MADQQRINGNVFGHSSLVLQIDDERYYGFKSFSYGDSLEVGKVWGMARHGAPRGRTAGKYDTEKVTASLEKETAVAVRKALAARSSTRTAFGQVEFQIVVQYEEGGRVITDELNRCRWTKTNSKSEEGPDAIYEEVEFDCLFIRHDGLVLFDDGGGTP
ncbi:hypothetical protein BAC2_02727 [uncultured bacterium]|nr:hypothetical protein BAC2_02727 [uncultured bacterium]